MAELTKAKVLKELKSLGTAQNRKVYANHGAANQYGVSFANIYKIQKKIKTNHNLAIELYESKVMEAMVLGCLVADPEKLTKTQANMMAKNLDFFMVGMYLAGLIAKTKFAQEQAEKMMKSKKDFVKAAGYGTLSTLLKNGHPFKTPYLKKLIKHIETNIHKETNRAKYSMNNTLIAIGTYTNLNKEAIAAGKRIGKVEVEHATKGCKTPFAPDYIIKARKRLKK